jgi:non-specific serine/threonine protein kinase
MLRRGRSVRSVPKGDTRPAWSRLLRGIRKAAGVTQDGWAAQLGVSGATVQRWERGVSVPNAEQEQALVALCHARGLFRGYHEGPLRGLTLTPELLRDLLVEARLGPGAGQPDPAEPPAARAGPLDQPPTPGAAGNLPLALTSFVGREQELAALVDRLTTTRLLTLTGPGGVGKTRLALELAAAVRVRYRDGAWLVDLAALPSTPRGNGATPHHSVHEGPRQPSDALLLVQQAVAAALDVRAAPTQPLIDTLITALRDRHLLLVLDNCEHLIAACAHLAETLLRACPRLHILATSREVLGVPGEVIWRVPPLSVPAIATRPGQGADIVSWMMAHDAVRLFVERARAAQPSFRVTPTNAAAVAQICAHLDGLPLALELAAARLTVLSVDQIAAGLSDRFRLLSTGSRTAPPRHQSLRAALDWSYALLSPGEQALLRRLAVFAGSWTLAEAEAICAPDDPPGIAAREVLNLLTHLVDKSLVLVDPQGEGSDTPRYRLLETVRQYAEEQLRAAGEDASLRDRHRDWYLALAEQAAPHLRGRDQIPWLDRLAAAHDNLRLALAWSLYRRAVEPGLRLAVALAWFWYKRGHWAEGHQWLARLLALADEAPATLRVRALAASGELAHAQGDYSRAITAFEQSLALARALADRDQIAFALAGLGDALADQGDAPRAIVVLEEALALSQEQANPSLTARILYILAKALTYQGELARAAERFEESLALFRQVEDLDGTVAVLHNRALIAWHQRDYARAAAALTETLDVVRALGDRRSAALALGNLALVAYSRGDASSGAAYGVESVRLFHELDDRWGLGLYVTVLAAIALLQRRPLRAARLAGAADAIRESIGATIPAYAQAEYTEFLARLRQSLGEEALAAAWAEGRAMSVDQAVALALAEAGRAGAA